MNELSNYIGLIGVTLVLLAYFFIQSKILQPNQISFSLLNLIGACLILVSLCYHWNLSSVIIEIAWISISLTGIYQWQKQLRLNSTEQST